MSCHIEETSLQATWPVLLRLKDVLASLDGNASRVYRWERVAQGFQEADPSGSGPGWSVSIAPEGVRASEPGGRLLAEEFAAGLHLAAHVSPGLDAGILSVLRLYVPLVLGAHAARLEDRVFVTGHIAQSLDGKVACANGHSQWISNLANQRHSHCLRALHDAVLVGSGTVTADDPRLTVRHVPGRQPARVLVSGRGLVLDLVPSHAIFQGAGCTVLLGSRPPEGLPGQVRCHGLTPDQRGRIPSSDLLAALAADGVHSVFVEGGPATLSTFLEERTLDVLHVHIAPVILGSGIAAFALPEITQVSDGPRFRCEHFEFDGEILIEARPGRTS